MFACSSIVFLTRVDRVFFVVVDGPINIGARANCGDVGKAYLCNVSECVFALKTCALSQQRRVRMSVAVIQPAAV